MKKSDANLIISSTPKGSLIFWVQLPKGFFYLRLLVTSLGCLSAASPALFSLRRGVASQSEDSDLFSLGKSSLKHPFKYFCCAIGVVFFSESSGYMLDHLIAHFCYFLSHPFILSLLSHFALFPPWSVSCFQPYLFFLVLYPILSSFCGIFKAFIPFLASALQLTSHLLMSCHVSELIFKRQ